MTQRVAGAICCLVWKIRYRKSIRTDQQQRMDKNGMVLYMPWQKLKAVSEKIQPLNMAIPLPILANFGINHSMLLLLILRMVWIGKGMRKIYAMIQRKDLWIYPPSVMGNFCLHNIYCTNWLMMV